MNNHQYIYIYIKQRSDAVEHEILPSNALILHLAFFFFLPLSLCLFYCYPKVHINLFTVSLLIFH